MRTLALSDEILMKIEKPSMYLGGEVNMIKKDPKKVDVRFAMAFPDVYTIGMSHLGIQIIYDLLNRRCLLYTSGLILITYLTRASIRFLRK